MTHYLCTYKDGKYIPIMGPMVEGEVVAIIQGQGSSAWRYSNFSRYNLTKEGYRMNKAGEMDIKCHLIDSQPDRDALDLSKPLRTYGALGHFLRDIKFHPTPTGKI